MDSDVVPSGELPDGSLPIAVQPAPAHSEVMQNERNHIAAFESYNIAKHDPQFYIWQVEGNHGVWFDLEKDIAKRFEDGVNGMGDAVFEVLCSGNQTRYLYNTKEKYQLNVTSGTYRLVRRLLISQKDVIENVIFATNVKRMNATKTSVSSRTT